jgi:hypothetical protein
MDCSRRALLSAVATATALAGCSDEDEEPPGLVAIDVLLLYREGDGWYDYPGEVGVQVTVENTDVDRHRKPLVVTLERPADSATWTKRREVELPGGTTRGYRFRFPVDDTGEGSYAAEARVDD